MEFIGYFVLAIYLDHILPDENGVCPLGPPGRLLWPAVSWPAVSCYGRPCLAPRAWSVLAMQWAVLEWRRQGSVWVPFLARTLPPALAAPAGVRKGRPWYFLSPNYWCGVSWRRSKKNAVRTAR